MPDSWLTGLYIVFGVLIIIAMTGEGLLQKKLLNYSWMKAMVTPVLMLGLNVILVLSFGKF